jgi:hypothetical protein
MRLLRELPRAQPFSLEITDLTFLVPFRLRYPFPSLQRTILQFFFVCHETKLIGDAFFSLHLQAIIASFPDDAHSPEMATMVLSSFQKNSLLAPIAVFVITKQGEQAVAAFVSSLTPSREYTKGDFWAVPFFYALAFLQPGHDRSIALISH